MYRHDHVAVHVDVKQDRALACVEQKNKLVLLLGHQRDI